MTLHCVPHSQVKSNRRSGIIRKDLDAGAGGGHSVRMLWALGLSARQPADPLSDSFYRVILRRLGLVLWSKA
jgi:hypothetical protein